MNHYRSVLSRFAGSVSRSAFFVSALMCLSMFAAPVSAQYVRTDLVSNQAGVAPTQDDHLVNGWGLVSLPTSPWWVSDNGTGFSTLYTAAGVQVQLFVAIPPAPSDPAGTLGTPTGIVGNISPNASDFTITEGGKSGSAVFIFATLDAQSVPGIQWLTAERDLVMPHSRLRATGRALALFTQAWRSRSTHLVMLSCTPRMMVRTAGSTCSTAHSLS